jgi:hypothetical protein
MCSLAGKVFLGERSWCLAKLVCGGGSQETSRIRENRERSGAAMCAFSAACDWHWRCHYKRWESLAWLFSALADYPVISF